MRPGLARNWGSLTVSRLYLAFLSLFSLYTQKALLHSLAPRTGISLFCSRALACLFLEIFGHPNVAAAASESTAPLSMALLLLVLLPAPPLRIMDSAHSTHKNQHQSFNVAPPGGSTAATWSPGKESQLPYHSIAFRATERPFALITDFVLGYQGKSLPPGLGEVAAKAYRGF